jgi:hypothetical protein
MFDRTARSRAGIRASLVVAMMAMAVSGAAFSQGKPPAPPAANDAAPAVPPAPDQPASAVAPPRGDNPGLFNEIGKLFDNPSSMLPSLPTLKSPKEAIDDFNARTKDAADGLSRLTSPLVVRGRVACPVTANGGPDCKAASDKLCQTKGFKEGKSLDTDQAQACSAAALLSGGNKEPGNCRTENYVTRALCQ